MIWESDRSLDRRWHLLEKDELARSLYGIVRIALEHDSQRRDDQRDLARIFEEHARQTFFSAGLSDSTIGPLPRNVMRGLVETAHALLLEATPRPFYASDGADFELRQRLEGLNRAVTGLFLQHHLDRHDSVATLHGSLWGVGCVKIDALTHTKKPRVRVERVYPWEILVDPLEAAYGDPHNWFQVRWVDRRALLDLWPQHEAEIRRSGTDRPEWVSHLESMADPVRVIEAWHCALDGEETGRHAIGIEGGLLLDEPYSYPEPPLCFFRFDEPLTGYWPTGLGHKLRGQQIEVNEMMSLIREIIRLCGSPGLLVHKNSNISEGQLDNVVARVIEYEGQRPDYFFAQGLTAEPRQHLLDTVAAMYDRAGIPQTSATGKTPAGLQSGRALRIHASLAAGRLRVPAANRQDFFLQLGRALVRAQREVAKVDPEALVVFTDPDTQNTHSLRWADVDVPDEGLELIAQPISKLPSTPEAKAELLEQYLNAGVISVEEYRADVDLPDLKSLNGPATAPRKLIERQLSTMLKEGRREVPERFFPLDTCIQMGSQYYCQGQLDGAPERHLGLVRDYVLAAIKMKEPPPAPPSPTAPAAMPSAPPGAPPMPPLGPEGALPPMPDPGLPAPAAPPA